MLAMTRHWLRLWWARASGGTHVADIESAAIDVPDAGAALQVPTHGAGFDNFMRSVASQATRRDALRVSAQGAFVTFMASLGLRPAYAAADCLCGRQLYDPLTQCCTPTGVQTKSPIADLARCPDRVASPAYSCRPNGCGAEGGQSFPGNYGAASFLGCCDTHDCCYGRCRSDRDGCDSAFLGCMRGSCDRAYPPDIVPLPGGFGSYDRNRVNRSLCRGQANSYYAAVQTYVGTNAHNAAQQNGCDCCGPQACPSCPGGTCASLPPCQDPGCVCFQTVEGRGFCHRGQSCAGLVSCASSSSCQVGWACVSVTCCSGSGAVCIRPCFVVQGRIASFESALSGTAAGPMTAPVTGSASR